MNLVYLENNMNTETSISLPEIEVDERQILRGIGYKNDSEPSVRISTLVNDHIQLAHQLVTPSYSHVINNVSMVRKNDVFVGDMFMFRSSVIARLLEKCQHVASFLVTIGNKLEKEATRLANKGLILESYVLDAIGSSMVENIAEHIEKEIGITASTQGNCISRRFSPGYCDWSIRQQKEIFRMIDGALVGVRLTTGFLMMPQKSISGVVGIGPACAEIKA